MRLLKVNVLQLCTCAVITGGHRVKTAAGCPFHIEPTYVMPTNGAAVPPILTLTLHVNGTNTTP